MVYVFSVCCINVSSSCSGSFRMPPLKHAALKMEQNIIGCDYIWGKLRWIGTQINISKWPAVQRRSDGPTLLSASSSHFHHNNINPLLGVYIGSLVADREGGLGWVIGGGGAAAITGTTYPLPITSVCPVAPTHHTHSIPTSVHLKALSLPISEIHFYEIKVREADQTPA